MPPRKRKCTPKLEDDQPILSEKIVISQEAQRLIDDVEEQGAKLKHIVLRALAPFLFVDDIVHDCFYLLLIQDPTSIVQYLSSATVFCTVMERVEGLLALASGMQQSIRQEFTLKLMQLPKQVLAAQARDAL